MFANGASPLLYADQVRLLYRLSRAGYAAAPLCAAIVAFALWDVGAATVHCRLARACSAHYGCALRALSSVHGGAPAARAVIAVGQPLRVRRGVPWVSPGALLGRCCMPAHESVYQLLIIFVIGGVTASAMIVLTPLRWAFPAFMLPAIVPLVIVIFMQTTSVHPLVGAMLIVLIGAMLATLPVVHGTHVASLRARFESNDALTGLPNRTMFNERLTQALARAERYRKQLAVLFIDLDRFKIINDTLGHAAGDALLTQLAAQLRSCLRESDTIGRQGGDEFVVLIEDVTDPQHTPAWRRRYWKRWRSPTSLNGQHSPRDREHRHQPLSRRRERPADAAEECRHRNVSRQGTRQERPAILFGADESAHAGAARARNQPARRHRARRSFCCITSRRSTCAAGGLRASRR